MSFYWLLGILNEHHLLGYSFNKIGQVLAGVGRQAFQVAALPLGVDGVEDQGALAAAAGAGDHDELFAWQADVDGLQVVLAGAADLDGGR